ncbi:MAG: glycosyltransferase [Chitinophagaceae bacterium]|nr:glycosyltransferase [Chitinophagaceae bacterium]
MSVSVVIPAYNGSAYIEQAILSVLGQQRCPDEILIYDDNSTDDTLDICRRYKDHVSVFSDPSGPSGFVGGWNKAIARAGGDYISILHQDDLLEPGFIRIGMAALERNPDIRHLFCICSYIDDRGRSVGESYLSDNASEVRLTGKEYIRIYQQLGSPHIHRCPGVITHRSIFDQCRYEPAAGHIADDDFFYRVGMYTDVMGILQPLAAFRVHDRSVTGGLQDAELAGKLMDDYIYQCRQWKGHPFLDEPTYSYFLKKAGKYIRRFIGYGIRRRNAGMIAQGIKRWNTLRSLRRHLE